MRFWQTVSLAVRVETKKMDDVRLLIRYHERRRNKQAVSTKEQDNLQIESYAKEPLLYTEITTTTTFFAIGQPWYIIFSKRYLLLLVILV